MSSCATLLLRWNPWDWQVMTSGDWFLRLWFCVLQRISRSPLGSWFYMGFGCSAYVWELQLVREAVAYGSLLNDSEKQACMLSLNAPARKAMIQILHVHVCATCIYMNIWCIHKHGYSHGIYLMIILNLRFGATNLSHFTFVAHGAMLCWLLVALLLGNCQFDSVYELTPASTRIMGVLTGEDDEGTTGPGFSGFAASLFAWTVLESLGNVLGCCYLASDLFPTPVLSCQAVCWMNEMNQSRAHGLRASQSSVALCS